MSLISTKKCPICYSILPHKVVFCPVCGTELQPNIEEIPVESKPIVEDSHSFPTARRLYGDEPLETSSVRTIEHSTGNQFAWKVSENVLPIKTKGQANYSEVLNPPKINLNFFRNLSILEILLFTIIGLSYSLIVVSQIAVSSILITMSIDSSWLYFGILVVTLIPSSVLLYFLNRKIVRTLAKQKESTLMLPKGQLFSFLFIQGTHLLSLGLITYTLFITIFPLSESTNPMTLMYIFMVLLTFIISIVSPPFKITKVLASIRDTGVIQNFQDAFQFPKLCLKRYILISVLSYLIPASILTLGLQNITNLFKPLFIPDTGFIVNGWDISISIIIWLIFAISIVFSSIEDVKTSAFYEESLQNFVDPPSLQWITREHDYEFTHKKKSSDEYSINSPPIYGSKEEFCSTCSETVIEGAEFCTNCGKKIVR